MRKNLQPPSWIIWAQIAKVKAMKSLTVCVNQSFKPTSRFR